MVFVFRNYFLVLVFNYLYVLWNFRILFMSFSGSIKGELNFIIRDVGLVKFVRRMFFRI